MNPPSLLRRRTGLTPLRAFSLVETVIALAIGSLAISGAMAINSQQLRLVKSTREASAASHALQERIEQARTATWNQITDPTYCSQTLFATQPKSIGPLAGYTERITLTAWPERSVPSPSPVMCVTKSLQQPAQVVSAGSGIEGERLVKVELQIKWGGAGNRERQRELTTIISNGGISRVTPPEEGGNSGNGNEGRGKINGTPGKK